MRYARKSAPKPGAECGPARVRGAAGGARGLPGRVTSGLRAVGGAGWVARGWGYAPGRVARRNRRNRRNRGSGTVRRLVAPSGPAVSVCAASHLVPARTDRASPARSGTMTPRLPCPRPGSVLRRPRP